MVFAVFACKPDIRITADETNLISTSQNLYEKKECFVVVSSCETENGKKSKVRISDFPERNRKLNLC